MIGIFGGTFDPPHLAHTVLAAEASDSLGLSEVLWVLTAQPPHKPDKPISAVEHRTAMVQIITADDEKFELSSADLEREPPHYTVGTISWLQERLPEERFAYIMGMDSLRDLPTWHKPQEFVQLCDLICVMRRQGTNADLNELEKQIPGLNEKLTFLDVPALEISGSEIRRRARAGEPYRYFLLPRIYTYVHSHKLYR